MPGYVAFGYIVPFFYAIAPVSSATIVPVSQTGHDGLVAESAEDAIVTAVNRGGDTDTIGAITGALAGARFRADSLPNRWVAVIDGTDELESLSGQLLTWRDGCRWLYDCIRYLSMIS